MIPAANVDESSVVIVVGLALTPIMIAGSFAGRRVVDRVSPRFFVGLIEVVLVIFGAIFLARG